MATDEIPLAGKNIHFRLHLEEWLSVSNYTPTNRDVIGYLYRLYIDRPTEKYHASINKYIPTIADLLTTTWGPRNIATLKYKAVRKRVYLLLKKYQYGLKREKKCNVDFDFLNELFCIQKPLVTNIEAAIGNLSLDTHSDGSFEAEPAMHESDTDYVPVQSDLDSSGEYKLVKIPRCIKNFNMDKICMAADRRNLSLRDTALIVSSTLEELGIVNAKDRSLIVDKNKMQKASKKSRIQAIENAQATPLLCFHFDGKAAKNLQMEEKMVDGRARKVMQRKKRVENIIIVQQPGDNFLGFLVCEKATSAAIFQKFLAFFTTKNISLDALVALGCDGAAVNTGHIKGIIRRFEEHLNRPLHWIICMLHLNERTFGNILEDIDGTTTGPTSHSGKIMQSIQLCHLKPVVDFVPITFGEMPPNMDAARLTNDQKYLLRIATMVDSGIVDENLMTLCPGPINNSRWMTSASRILRQYVSEINPSTSLVLLAKYVMCVYIPVWFQTKIQPFWYHGSKHFFHLLKYTRTHTPALLSSVTDTLLNNSFYAHPENLLLAMISDESESVRQKAYTKIIECRRSSNDFLRTFYRPTEVQMNLDCEVYHELIHWTKLDITEPPITKQFSLSQLRAFKRSKDIINIPPIPSHTQSCEHHIQALSDSVVAVAGVESQEGHLRNTIRHRKKMGIFNTKSNYNPE